MIVLVVAFMFVAVLGTAHAEDVIEPPSELKKLSLEELFEIEVTSASKKPEKLSEAAAAIHVVTDEDIRRSGARSIPEALRHIAGVEVARVDASDYAITARGFNGTIANKLLVLMDGRSVYTPLFSGVFWDAQDTFLEDIARIEVIRGPGATVWGANAVNGVINAITKTSDVTQGLLATGGGGNEERGFAGVRYGGRFSPDASYRVYGKWFDRDDSVFPGGQDAEDRFRMGQGGFRIDWRPSTADLLTVQGDLYGGSVEQPAADDVDLGGGNLLGRWTRELSEVSNVQVQAYYDRTERDIPPVFAETLDTYDLEVQHRFPLGERQEVVWGFGYRNTRNDVDNSLALAFLPSHLTHHLYTAFIQDEFSLVKDELRLALGSKFEHNDYTGFEYQPSVRLAWTPVEEHTLWTALSRVVRTPSRIDRDLFVPEDPPFLLAGGPDFESEVLYALELGYKTRPAANLTGSVATFYNMYDDLRSLEAGPPAVLANELEGETYGAELEAAYQARPWWRLEGGYTHLRLQLRAKRSSTDTNSENQEGDSPRHQLFLLSRMDLPGDLEFDVSARRVEELQNQMVPAYTGLGARLAWKPIRSIELSVVGQNLLGPRHAEFGAPATRREVERSVYGKVTWSF